DRPGGRCGNAPYIGHGGVLGDARRDAVRHLPDAGVLLRHRRGGELVASRSALISVGAASRAAPALICHLTPGDYLCSIARWVAGAAMVALGAESLPAAAVSIAVVGQLDLIVARDCSHALRVRREYAGPLRPLKSASWMGCSDHRSFWLVNRGLSR